MAQVKIILTSSADFNIIRVDDVEVMREPGTRTIELPEGPHVMTWQIKGQKGDSYTLSITEPESLAFVRKITLDRYGLDFGYHSFTI
jgi:hypothetical protein